MTAPLAVLSYAGPAPAQRRSIVYVCWRGVVFLITSILLILFVTLRASVLLAGFLCVFVGTMLLVIGGKRGAAETAARWREHAIDLLRLWRSDMTRYFRGRRGSGAARATATPVVVAPVSAVAS